MRLAAAFIPAGLITLVLFVLMQYLITGGRPPAAPPAHSGFVDLIRLQVDHNDADTPVSARAAPAHRRLSENTPPLPQTPGSEIGPPELSPLDISVAEPPPPALARAPSLGAFEPPPLADNRVAMPEPQAAKSAANGASPTLAPAPAVTAAAADLDGSLDGISHDDGNPIPVLRIEPVYPRKAARNRKEGWVKLAFTITERGTVIDPVVLESRPRRLFNRSAVAAIRKWRFKPKLIDGAPVSTRATQVIEFKLAGR